MAHKTAKYFAPAEFKKCSPACSIDDMDADFLKLLDAVREKARIPLVLSCAYRSKVYDKAKGRSGNSAHTRGLAVDIVCNASRTRYRIVRAALECGITRIGIGRTFVHIDADPTLDPDVIWDYYE